MHLIEETDLRFYMAESTIENAGYGLFAKEHLKKGDFIEIIGVYVKIGSISDDCTHYANDYKFGAKPLGEVCDRYIVPMGYGGLVNHSDDPKIQNAAIDSINHPPRNADGSKLAYVFLRDIERGEEVVGNYGENWNRIFATVKEFTKEAEESPDEWETFLSLDLYNLGKLKTKIDKENDA